MNRLLLLLVLIGTGQGIYAQYVYTIKADSVKITNSCDTAELIIENHTQNVPGFLYNKGRGRTEFRRGAIAINDSLYMIGGDTINLYKGRVNVTASNGLYAENSHVKFGGEITDMWSDAWFAFNPQNPDDNYKEFGIYAHDYNGYFRLVENYYGGNYPSPFFLDFDGKGGGFSSGSGGFFAYTNTQVGRMSISIDSFGAHIMNADLQVGFPNNLPAQMYGRAHLQIAPGTSSEGGAPLKFSPGSLLTSPESDAVEYDGYDLYFTEHSVRYKLAKTLQGQLTTNFGGPSLSAFNSVTTTLTVAGAQPGDVVNVSANTGAVNPPSIIITAYVTSSNTVTLQAYNASSSSVTIASATYKVRVIK